LAGPTLFIRPFSSMPVNLPFIAPGPNSIFKNRSRVVRVTPRPFAPSPSNGSASCSSAGAIVAPTMKTPISPLSNAAAHL
jgi:hypothetical protein